MLVSENMQSTNIRIALSFFSVLFLPSCLFNPKPTFVANRVQTDYCSIEIPQGTWKVDLISGSSGWAGSEIQQSAVFAKCPEGESILLNIGVHQYNNLTGGAGNRSVTEIARDFLNSLELMTSRPETTKGIYEKPITVDGVNGIEIKRELSRKRHDFCTDNHVQDTFFEVLTILPIKGTANRFLTFGQIAPRMIVLQYIAPKTQFEDGYLDFERAVNSVKILQ